MAKDLEKASDIGTNPFLSGINPDVPQYNTNIAPDDDTLGTIARLSQNTLKALERDSLPCLPSDYQLYFEKLLDKEPPLMRDKIRAIMDMQSDIQNRALIFEKAVGENVKIIKQALNCISVIYQNLVISQNTIKRYAKDMEQADNKLVFRNVKDSLLRDTDQITSVASKQLEQIQDFYAKIRSNIKHIGQNSVYDLRFDVYNKKYFTSLLKKERQLCKEFNHSSILIYVSLARSITLNIGQDSPTFALLVKTMARFLQKHIRSSNALAYIGNGIFGILLKYSDVLEAQELCVTLYQIAQSTDIFVADSNIQLDIASSIAKINNERLVEDTMSACLTTLRIALEEKQHCKVYQQDSV